MKVFNLKGKLGIFPIIFFELQKLLLKISTPVKELPKATPAAPPPRGGALAWVVPTPAVPTMGDDDERVRGLLMDVLREAATDPDDLDEDIVEYCVSSINDEARLPLPPQNALRHGGGSTRCGDHAWDHTTCGDHAWRSAFFYGGGPWSPHDGSAKDPPRVSLRPHSLGLETPPLRAPATPLRRVVCQRTMYSTPRP